MSAPPEALTDQQRLESIVADCKQIMESMEREAQWVKLMQLDRIALSKIIEDLLKEVEKK